jgi:hypothetical protein
MLLLVFAAASIAVDFYMYILGQMIGGYIGNIVVHKLVSMLLLCSENFRI